MILLFYLIPIFIGILIMRKLDIKTFNFIYLIGSLIVAFIFLNLDGDAIDNLFYTLLPVAISFVSGYIYFAIKNKYFF